MNRPTPFRRRPRFSVKRLLGGATIIGVGCWCGTFFNTREESLVVVMASVGSGLGALFRGPVGALLGAAYSWLVMTVCVMLITLFWLAYLMG